MQNFLLDSKGIQTILDNFHSSNIRDMVENKLKSCYKDDSEIKIFSINLEFYNGISVLAYFPSNFLTKKLENTNFLEEVKKITNPKIKRKGIQITSFYIPFKINEFVKDCLKSLFILNDDIWLKETSTYDSSNLIPILEYLGFKVLNSLLLKLLKSSFPNNIETEFNDSLPLFNNTQVLQNLTKNLILTYFNAKAHKTTAKFTPNLENTILAKRLLKEALLFLKKRNSNTDISKKLTDNEYKSFLNSIITDDIDSKSLTKFLITETEIEFKITNKNENNSKYNFLMFIIFILIVFVVILFNRNFYSIVKENKQEITKSNNSIIGIETDKKELNNYNNSLSGDETKNDFISDSTQRLIEDSQHISKQSVSFNNLGLDYFNKGNLAISLEYFMKAIENDSRNSVAYFNIGLIYYNQGHNDLALEYYEKAINKNPTFSAAYFNVGLLYFHKGDLKKAIIYYTSAIELDPNYSTAYSNLGLAYFNSGDHVNSEKNYIKSIELDPKNSIAQFNLGLLYYSRGKLEKAKDRFIKAVELDNKYVNAYYNLANTYYDLGDKDNAIENYIKCLNLDRTNYIVFFNMGLAYYSKGEIENALKSFQKTLEINPKYSPAYFNIGFIYYSEKKYDHALRYYKKTIDLNPSNSYAKLSLGLVYYKQDKYELAIEQFNLVKEIEINKKESERDKSILDQVEQFKKEVYNHIDSFQNDI